MTTMNAIFLVLKSLHDQELIGKRLLEERRRKHWMEENISQSNMQQIEFKNVRNNCNKTKRDETVPCVLHMCICYLLYLVFT